MDTIRTLTEYPGQAALRGSTTREPNNYMGFYGYSRLSVLNHENPEQHRLIDYTRFSIHMSKFCQEWTTPDVGHCLSGLPILFLWICLLFSCKQLLRLSCFHSFYFWQKRFASKFVIPIVCCFLLYSFQLLPLERTESSTMLLRKKITRSSAAERSLEWEQINEWFSVPTDAIICTCMETGSTSSNQGNMFSPRSTCGKYWGHPDHCNSSKQASGDIGKVSYKRKSLYRNCCFDCAHFGVWATTYLGRVQRTLGQNL